MRAGPTRHANNFTTKTRLLFICNHQDDLNRLLLVWRAPFVMLSHSRKFASAVRAASGPTGRDMPARVQRGTSAGPGCGRKKRAKAQRAARIAVMPQSLARVIFHIVFSTKHRTPF